MVDKQPTFLEQEEENIRLRLAQITETDKPEAEAKLEAILQEELLLGRWLSDLIERKQGKPVTREPQVPEPPQAEEEQQPPSPTPRQEPEPKPKKEKKAKPKSRPVQATPATMEAVWVELRKFRDGAMLNDVAEKLPISSSYVGFALKQLLEEGRVTKTDDKRMINGRNVPVKIWKIVSPQAKAGAPADPTSRPRGPRPEDTAPSDRSVKGPQWGPPKRGTPVAGTGRRSVVLPKHRDTANIVLEAVKQGWYTMTDGRDHIRVIRPEKTDASGKVVQAKAEIRVYSTPNAPSLDKIRKQFKEHGVSYNE